MKALTVSRAKKKAWDAFSIYIRSRYATSDGYASCITCNISKPIKELQAGHFIPGRHNAVLFDERNVHSQCYHCNVGLKGNLIEYYDKMKRIYGEEVIEELRVLDRQSKQFKVFELVDIAEYYKSKLKQLAG